MIEFIGFDKNFFFFVFLNTTNFSSFKFWISETEEEPKHELSPAPLRRHHQGSCVDRRKSKREMLRGEGDATTMSVMLVVNDGVAGEQEWRSEDNILPTLSIYSLPYTILPTVSPSS